MPLQGLVSQASIELLRIPSPLPLPSAQKPDCALVPLGSAGRDEVTPGSGVRGLLNTPPLDGVLLLEGSGFDGLAELELLKETFSVWA
jgi:hypothetical protein